MKSLRFSWILAFVLSNLFWLGCSSKKVKPELSQSYLRDKIVALANIEGAKDARLQVEVALVNEIINHGRFQIIDRKSVQDALVEHPAESDWKKLGEKLNADLILDVDVLEFKADKRSGYDSVNEADTILAAEHSENRNKKWKKYYKVKQREGFVRLRFRFFDVKQAKVIFLAESEATASYNSRDGDMPRTMKLLEDLTTEAFTKYFDGLPE